MGDKIWTFRGDGELDPILTKWSKQSEKSFHVRQALRQYLNGTNFIQTSFDLSKQTEIEPQEAEISFAEWG